MSNRLISKDKKIGSRYLSKKKIIISICLSMYCIVWIGSDNLAFTQTNNLYFNQVINQGVTSAVCYTVPANTVFKLEGALWSAGVNPVLEFGTACSDAAYGGIAMSTGYTAVGPSGNASQGWPFPLWFKAGTVIGASANTIYITGILFNVAP